MPNTEDVAEQEDPHPVTLAHGTFLNTAVDEMSAVGFAGSRRDPDASC